ncbi:hypothetical protein GGQ91_002485 [Methylobacterium fujisawaense]|uniref:Lipoprotein n=1 Tax=Methylobacterium fujisawaense TaxID=107400 RepID=A0ABR6DAH3_9HYPH|nr:hypothetical protein [Methylobacterium fujisawaense]
MGAACLFLGAWSVASCTAGRTLISGGPSDALVCRASHIGLIVGAGLIVCGALQ